AVVDAGDAPSVAFPSPQLSRKRKARCDGAVDVGELVGLLAAVRPAGTGEEADILDDLLFQIHADAAAALVLPDGADIGRASGDGGELDRVCEAAHPGTGEEAGDSDLARLAQERVAPLDLAVPLELAEGRIQRGRIRRDRH